MHLPAPIVTAARKVAPFAADLFVASSYLLAAVVLSSLVLFIKDARAAQVPPQPGDVIATYTSPEGGRLLIYNAPCVLYGEVIDPENARKLVAIAPSGETRVGCVGTIQGETVALFEAGGENVAVFRLGHIQFRRAVNT